MSRAIAARLRAFNQGRLPARVALKYQAMRQNAFVFLRGTSHLFYEDWPKDTALNHAPLTWLCGDLHLENFGSYKGDNRLVYFDVNDFDEAALAPCTWDVTRFVTSLLVAAPVLGLSKAQARGLGQRFLTTYAGALARGQIRNVERATAEGLVRELLRGVKARKRAAFLDAHTQQAKAARRLVLDDAHFQPAERTERQQVKELIEQAGRAAGDKKFFKVLDVVQRLAGTGSLGVRRYAVLVEGKGSPDGNYILDLKETRASALEPYLTAPQPAWSSPAERAVAAQRRFQGTPPALLSAHNADGISYLLRELQPLQDRVRLAQWGAHLAEAATLMDTMAHIVAWGQLRSGGRQGSAIADELMAFGAAADWPAEVWEYAQRYAAQVAADHKEFAAAYDAETL